MTEKAETLDGQDAMSRNVKDKADAMGLYTVTPDKIQGINMLIYGYQGVGKTMFAAGAQDHPKMRDVLFLNIEGGLMTVAKRNDIMAIDVTSTEQIEQIFWMLKAGEKPLDKVRTVVIDSVTELQTLNLEQISQRRKSGTDLITREDYMKSTTTLKRLLRMYRDLPINVIYNALPKEQRETDDGPPSSVIPSLTASLAQSVMGYMDLVWYMWQTEQTIGEGDAQKRVKVRKMLTQDQGIYRGKTRGPQFAESLGLVVENPSLPEIYDKWIS